MYELYCPFCKHKHVLPFARTGAISRCANCNKQYKIKESNLTHTVHIKSVNPGQTDPLVPGLQPVSNSVHDSASSTNRTVNKHKALEQSTSRKTKKHRTRQHHIKYNHKNTKSKRTTTTSTHKSPGAYINNINFTRLSHQIRNPKTTA